MHVFTSLRMFCTRISLLINSLERVNKRAKMALNHSPEFKGVIV